MSYALSDPIEKLIKDQSCADFKEKCDVLIVGSGYGGAIAAMRLAGLKPTVYVFERGSEHTTGEFPEATGVFAKYLQFRRPGSDGPLGYPDALFDIHIGDPVSVLVGSGLGGTSLINANVALEPAAAVFNDPAWPTALRNKAALQASFDEVRLLLGVNAAQPGQKFKALNRLAISLGAACNAAPIAVTQSPNLSVKVTNNVGIEQNPCIGCANCVTGCNVGAKNTLPLNALPLAKARGAQLFTGATVLSIEPADGAHDGSAGWQVRFRRTATAKTVLQPEVFTMHAGTVILAGGALGSTEILLRSQARGKMKFSARLGSGFSGNGDVLAFGYGQQEPVNAVANSDFANVKDLTRASGIGPTITGYAKVDTGVGAGGAPSGRNVTIEDGAVPSAFTHLFAEALTTAAVPRRDVNPALPAWFKIPGNHAKDPLAVHPGALDHSQVLLTMGNDEAIWNLELQPCTDAPHDHDRATVRIAATAIPSVYPDIDRLLEQGKSNGGFDGGDYLPNPFWKFMPDGLSQVSNAPAPGGRLVSVHPLGGCPMGDDADCGVVNDYGQAFRPDGGSTDSVYKSLYVMDGAILPGALGLNPFLTIAALAYRNAGHIAQSWNAKAHGLGTVTPAVKQIVEATLPAPNPTPPIGRGYQVKEQFVEWMVGSLKDVPEWLINSLGQAKREQILQLSGDRTLVLKGRIDIPNVLEWLREPNSALKDAQAWLYVNRAPTANTVLEEQLEELVRGAGQVELLAWDRPCCWFQKVWRAVLALSAFGVRRWEELLEGATSIQWRQPMQALKSFGQTVVAFWHVACNHANWRYLRYTFTFNTPAGKMTLKGTKWLAYSLCEKDPWTALVDLPIRLRGPWWWQSVAGILTVDMIKLTQKSPFQVEDSPNTPVTISAMASAVMMMFRVLFQTHFWSFGAPNYPKQKLVRDPLPMQQPNTSRDPGPLRQHESEGALIMPTFITLPVPVSREAPHKKVNLRLTRYEHKSPPQGSILLIHGLAHSSLVFATDTIKQNLPTYLYRKGYDVWLLDYRASIALPDEVPGRWLADNPWTMDQMAYFDMHEAVKYVYCETGHQPIQVLAHCVGAGCLAMAILEGRCHDTHTNRSMIATLATHAVHPWMVPSRVNHVKTNLAAFVRDVLPVQSLDAVLPDEMSVTASDVLLDRLARSFTWSEWADRWRHRFETDARKGREICDRITLFYSYQWKHENLTCATHEELAKLLGIGNLEALRQLYFILLRRRLTTRDGENKYVLKENFHSYWTFPTLFAHGNENQLYDPKSAESSFLRLREIQACAPNPQDVHLFQVPDCGHMDLLLGKDAATKVYPAVDAFFRRARAIQKGQSPQAAVQAMPALLQTAWSQIAKAKPTPALVPYWELSKIPTCGPIIGWTRKSNDDIVLRLWVQPYLFSAVNPRGTTPGGVDIPAGFRIEKRPLPDSDPDYPGKFWVYDLTVPQDFAQDLRIAVVYDQQTPCSEFRIKIEAVAPEHDAVEKTDYELHDPKKGVRLPLANLPWFRRLQGKKPADQVAFLVCSCRYPGSPFDEEQADSIYAGMRGHVNNSPERIGIDHVLLVGDQIYADATADLFDARELPERYAGQCREAFGAPHLRRLLTSVPTYMAIDDHEFEDNWPGNADKIPGKVAKAYMERFRYGLAAAKAYQWSMTAQTGWPPPAPSPHDVGLWHTFESGVLPFFVMDTRTERTLRQEDVSVDKATIIGPRQWEGLKAWLLDIHHNHETTEKPKFIVSGAVLAPAAQDYVQEQWLYRNSDSWWGYPQTWRELVQLIVKHQMKRVVFVSGDYHLSALAEMTLSSSAHPKPVIAYSIVASAFYAPLPFANSQPADYVWGPQKSLLPFSDTATYTWPVGSTTAKIEVEPYLLCTESRHFLRVDAQPASPSAGSAKWVFKLSVCDQNGVLKPERPLGGPFTIGADNVVRWII